MSLNNVQPNRIAAASKDKVWDFTAATLRCDTPTVDGDAANKGYVDSVGGVTSVNGETGAVVLSTTDIPEGSNLYYTDERAQDAVGGILSDSGDIDFTYTDATPSISADVKAGLSATKIADGSVSNTEFQYIGGLTSDAQTQLGTKLVKSNNLSDLTDAATARTNLGLGTIATLNTVDISANTNLSASNGVALTGDALNADIVGLAADATPVAATDYVMTYDASAAVNKKVLISDLPGGAVDSVNGQTGVVVLDTDDIAEATNLYFTDERAQDAVGNAVGAGLSYNDGTGAISSTITQYTDEMAQDAVGNAVGAGLSYDDGTGAISSTITQYTDEMAQDAVGNAVGAGLAYDDGTGVISSTITQYTNEMAEDAVGGILTDTNTIDFTYNDTTIVADVRSQNTSTVNLSADASGLKADVNANTSVQKIEVTKNSGAVVGTRKQLNFIEGSNVTLTVSDDGGNDQVDITIAASGGGGSGPTLGLVSAINMGCGGTFYGNY